MKTFKTLLAWLLIAGALVALYLFCTVTCAPIRENSVHRFHSFSAVAAFVVVLTVQVLRAIRRHYSHKQVIR